MKINLPNRYNYKYTIDLLIRLLSIDTGKEIRVIESELADLMNLKTRMVRYYRTEREDSTRKQLSDIVLEKLGLYFDVEPQHLITQVVRMGGNVPLTASTPTEAAA